VTEPTRADSRPPSPGTHANDRAHDRVIAAASTSCFPPRYAFRTAPPATCARTGGPSSRCWRSRRVSAPVPRSCRLGV